MPRGVKIKRETKRLLQTLALTIGEGLHSSFRKRASGIAADNAWYAIGELDKEVWRDICLTCARTTTNFALKYPQILNSVNSRGKLAFLLAKISLQKFKHYKWKGDRYAKQTFEAIQDMTFKRYRNMLDGLADELITLLTCLQDNCTECRYAKRDNQKCPSCNKCCCPIHCRCTVGGRRVTKRRTS